MGMILAARGIRVSATAAEHGIAEGLPVTEFEREEWVGLTGKERRDGQIAIGREIHIDGRLDCKAQLGAGAEGRREKTRFCLNRRIRLREVGRVENRYTEQ